MRPVLLLVPFLLLLNSCGNLQNLATKSRIKRQEAAMKKLAETSSEEATARLGAKAVGEVAYVDEVDQFVHLRLLTGTTLPAGIALETRPAGKRAALLRTTAERNKFFVIADLIEGLPAKGDSVFPSTAKAKPNSLRKLAPADALKVAPDSVPADPGLSPASDAPDHPVLTAPDLPTFDPANLPPLADPVKTPQDLQR